MKRLYIDIPAFLETGKGSAMKRMKVQPPGPDYKLGTVLETTGDKRKEGKSFWYTGNAHNQNPVYFSPPYLPGEIVNLPEEWCEDYWGKVIYYKADGHESPGPDGFWRKAITMPAIAARYHARIVSVRAELRDGAWEWVIETIKEDMKP